MSDSYRPAKVFRCHVRLSRLGSIAFVGAAALASLFSVDHPNGVARADNADAQAIMELQKFFADPAAMASYAAQTGGAAAAAQADLKRYPPEVQREILEIVMMIMKESGSGATKHIEANQKGGAGAAFGSFSPAVQQRIKDLARKIKPESLGATKATGVKP